MAIGYTGRINLEPDAIDKLAKAVDIAKNVYGIYSDTKTLDLAKQRLAAETNQNSKKGLLTENDLATGGYDVTDEPTPGHNKAYILPQGEETPIVKYIQKPMTLFDDPYGLKSSSAEKAKQDVAKGKIEATQLAKGKPLAQDKLILLQDGATIPGQLSEIETTLSANKDMFGPTVGRARSYNPFDSDAQTVESQLRASAQAFGRYMEGGVLRKEDEDKYKKMFPGLADTPEVAKNKLDVVRNLLVNKQNAYIGLFKNQGYDTTGLDKLSGVSLPKVLGGSGADKGFDPEKEKRLNELKLKLGK